MRFYNFETSFIDSRFIYIMINAPTFIFEMQTLTFGFLYKYHGLNQNGKMFSIS